MTRVPSLWIVVDRLHRRHYLTACKPVRADGGCEFIGLAVALTEHAGVEGVTPTETFPLLHNFPGADCEFCEIPPTMVVPSDVRRQLIELARPTTRRLEAA
ncbi:MAG: hypothetical protein QM679_08215 [Patulibacter sp.]